MKIFWVFELGPMPEEWQMPELIAAVKQARPDWEHDYFHAPSKRYQPGGAHPRRLLHMLYMHAVLPWKIWRERPAWIVARTSPPMIQQAASFWGACFGVKVGCWLMDYHPLIEIEKTRKLPVLRPLHYLLDKLDRWALGKMRFIVVLDEAMRACCAQRLTRPITLLTYPTWGRVRTVVSPSARSFGDQINLVYAGHLGQSHPAEPLFSLLGTLAKRKRVRLHYVGQSPVARARFAQGAQAYGFDFSAWDRQAHLGQFFETQAIHYGIVLMDEASAGLISPSKYTGYLQHGLPILYFGPKGTNAHAACEVYGAGHWIKPEDSNLCDRVLDASAYTHCCEATAPASQALVNRGPEGLAALLLPLFEQE